ncbi:MAG: PqqD family protein [Candidatus Dadabacteria bacterium]|nr:PqqD family protein [Candidatus Dadabacteria bacterium]
MNEFPKMVDDIEINEVEDGYVIYQKEKDKVHYLNKTAVLILECCTGANSAIQIGKIVQEAYDLPEIPEKEVNDCLNKLYQEGLIK